MSNRSTIKLFFDKSAVMTDECRPIPGRRSAPAQRAGVNPVVAAVMLLMCASTGCRATVKEEALPLVTHYNNVVSEAYRRDDVSLVDGVVGIEEGKRLTGLIGVRHDLGLTMDSQLLSLDITDVERGRDEIRVKTREQWKYCDRRIGTGEIVGEAGIDSYEMLYIFKKEKQNWLMEEIRFLSKPQVGRKPTTWAVERPVRKQP